MRPYVLLSAAMSVDGHIDDSAAEPLRLSNDEDFARVNELRASCDAILVGANTIRRDDPRLVLQDHATLRDHGTEPGPMKVTLTRGGDLDPGARFFTMGDVPKLVYCPPEVVPSIRDRLPAEVIGVDGLPALLSDLSSRGVNRLMVEGGESVQSELLQSGLADELQLAISPIFVGEPGAPRIGHDVAGATRPMRLVATWRMGDVIMLRYLRGTDHAWLQSAVELSAECPPSWSAFSVGAIIVTAGGAELARGRSRESDPKGHAEEAVLAKVDPDDPRLSGATLYCSLEPCGKRASRPLSCSRLIVEAGISRVVFAWREPPVFIAGGTGAEDLRAAGVEVVEIPALAPQVRSINAHLFAGKPPTGRDSLP